MFLVPAPPLCRPAPPDRRPALRAPRASGPTAPSNVTAAAEPGQVELSWRAPLLTRAAVTGYLIVTDDLTTGVDSAPAASPNGAATSTTLRGLTAGDRYRFTVQARTTDGDTPASDPSDPVTAEAPARSPGGPPVSPSQQPVTPPPTPRHARHHRPRRGHGHRARPVRGR